MEDGVTGLIFKGGDQADLTRKLKRLQQEPSLAADMGRQAFERFWQNAPTLERHCRDLEAAYAAMLDQPPSSSSLR